MYTRLLQQLAAFNADDLKRHPVSPALAESIKTFATTLVEAQQSVAAQFKGADDVETGIRKKINANINDVSVGVIQNSRLISEIYTAALNQGVVGYNANSAERLDQFKLLLEDIYIKNFMKTHEEMYLPKMQTLNQEMKSILETAQTVMSSSEIKLPESVDHLDEKSVARIQAAQEKPLTPDQLLERAKNRMDAARRGIDMALKQVQDQTWLVKDDIGLSAKNINDLRNHCDTALDEVKKALGFIRDETQNKKIVKLITQLGSTISLPDPIQDLNAQIESRKAKTKQQIEEEVKLFVRNVARKLTANERNDYLELQTLIRKLFDKAERLVHSSQKHKGKCTHPGTCTKAEERRQDAQTLFYLAEDLEEESNRFYGLSREKRTPAVRKQFAIDCNALFDTALQSKFNEKPLVERRRGPWLKDFGAALGKWFLKSIVVGIATLGVGLIPAMIYYGVTGSTERSSVKKIRKGQDLVAHIAHHHNGFFEEHRGDKDHQEHAAAAERKTAENVPVPTALSEEQQSADADMQDYIARQLGGAPAATEKKDSSSEQSNTPPSPRSPQKP